MDRGSQGGDALLRLWRAVAARYPSYDLVLPGENSLICCAATCNAWCCRALSVPLGDADVQRMEGASGLAPARFLECEDGEPIALPLADPYLLARRDGACALLEAGGACSQYAGRPAACRLYPYQVAWLDGKTGNPSGRDRGGAIALLLRHRECPGFTGPRLSEEGRAGLLAEMLRLQSGAESTHDWSERET